MSSAHQHSRHRLSQQRHRQSKIRIPQRLMVHPRAYHNLRSVRTFSHPTPTSRRQHHPNPNLHRPMGHYNHNPISHHHGHPPMPCRLSTPIKTLFFTQNQSNQLSRQLRLIPYGRNSLLCLLPYQRTHFLRNDGSPMRSLTSRLCPTISLCSHNCTTHHPHCLHLGI